MLLLDSLIAVGQEHEEVDDVAKLVQITASCVLVDYLLQQYFLCSHNPFTNLIVLVALANAYELRHS